MIVKNSLSLAMVLTLGTSLVQALPDSRNGNPLNVFGIETPIGVGDVVRDHEKPNTLHVGPANVKQIQGLYSEIDSSGAMCIDFVNIRKQAYFTPVTPAQKDQAYQNGEFISNYFQITYAIVRDNKDTLKQIQIARTKLREYEKSSGNPQLVARYHTLNSEWLDLITQLSSLKEEKSELNDSNVLKVAGCITGNPNNPPAMIQCLTNTANWYAAEKAKIDLQLVAPLARKKEIQKDYYAARGDYVAYKENLDMFQSDIAFNTAIISAQLSVTKSAWKIETDVVKAEEGKIVGRASAGYNLFDNEVNLLSQTLAAHGLGRFEVKQLDVFNVALNSGVTVENPTVSTDKGSSIFTKNTWSFPADTLMKSSIVGDWAMPFEREDRGDTIHFDTMDKNSFAAGAFDFYVTKGARCGEYSQYVKETFTATEGGIETKWVVKQKYYEPLANKAVFTQSIGLSYNYYAYPGPIKGNCSIDVDRMSSYWRDQGHSRSWRWFKRNRNTWDHTRTEARDNMGMECTLDLKPVDNDPVKARELTEQFERHMYDDMWQMFLAMYAKEYKVEVIEPEGTDEEKSEVGNTLGTGLMKMCGGNVVCQFSGIVLKTLDEIGGSKAQGTQSSQSRVYGRIWKHYDKNTFAVKGGSSLINLKVCVDPTKCN